MKDQQKQDYQQHVDSVVPKSPLGYDCFKAFITGGAICVVGQVISMLGESYLKLTEDNLAAFTSVVMVFLGALLTGIGVYDKIGNFGGAGAAVPITGFSNGIVSSAMEFRKEGLVMGVGAKMFTIAGPVLVFGIVTSTLVGAVWLLFNTFF